jgi:hypothetical protein
MSQTNINPAIALAILNAAKKGIDAKTAREETAPGVYRDIKVDLTIELEELRVAPDTDKAPTTSIPMLTTCALLLQRFQPNDREQALEIFRQVMMQALDMSQDKQKQLLKDSGVAELEKTLKEEVISKLPRVPVKGAVTVRPEQVRVTLNSMTMRPPGATGD